jgi:hypothetical protein
MTHPNPIESALPTPESTDLAKSSAEKMKTLRKKWRAAGFRLLQLWVHPADMEKVKAFADRLIAKRGGKP